MKIRHLNPLRPDLFVAGLALVTLACFGSAWACGSPEAKSAAYGAKLDACVETATTLEQSRACRRAVTLAAGRDAGPAPSFVPCAAIAVDAGLLDAGEGGAR